MACLCDGKPTTSTLGHEGSSCGAEVSDDDFTSSHCIDVNEAKNQDFNEEVLPGFLVLYKKFIILLIFISAPTTLPPFLDFGGLFGTTLNLLLMNWSM